MRVATDFDIICFKYMEMNGKVPIAEAKSSGSHVLGSRWVDVRTAGGPHRSRLVANDINTYNTPEIFAATPPIDTLKFILRKAAQDKPLYMMHIDLTGHVSTQKANRNLYVKLPAEDHKLGEEHLRDKLNNAMNGSRDAAQTWQRLCAETKRESSFEVGKVFPCHFCPRAA